MLARTLFAAAALLHGVPAAGALGASAPRRALVVGGSGRVGGSTVRWLAELADETATDLSIGVGGRSQASYDASVRRLRARAGARAAERTEFVACDLDDRASLERALRAVDVCVHTAGPFQSVERPTLLAACVDARVPYVDVCDNTELARYGRRELDARARAAGVPAVVAAGIWPGVSALMAADALSRLPAGTDADSVELSFHTAGTGNAGTSIVAATFHLLAEPAWCVRDGRPARLSPWTERRDVEFGAGLGTRAAYLLDNPDIPTLAETVAVPAAEAAELGAQPPGRRRVRSMSSRFGTAPQVWNDLFGVVALVPDRVLLSRPLMAAAAGFSEPIIRLVDRLVGATNAMRVDVVGARPAGAGGVDPPRVTLQLVHPDLEECVGLATAAFAWELLSGTVPPGVRYACELAGTPAGDSIVARARAGAGGVWSEHVSP